VSAAYPLIMSTPPPAVRRPFPFGRSLSLERKLPLLMTGVLVVVVAASLALTYRALTHSARVSIATRLSRAARQLSASAETALNTRAALVRQVADDSAIRALLDADARQPHNRVVGPAGVADDSSAGTIAVREALAKLIPATDSQMPVELWSANGVLLARIGDTTRARLATEAKEPPDSPAWEADSDAFVRPDSMRVGRFYVADGRVFFGIWRPVYDGRRRIGLIAERHRVAASPRTARILRDLMGAEVTAHYANASGELWARLTGEPDARLEARDLDSLTGVFRANRKPAGELVATEVPIGGTPWSVALELPIAAVLAGPRATMMRLLLLSLILVAASVGASWLISRRITQPLASLTLAADAVAQGDFSHPVDVAGEDEVGHLARSFTSMRDQVGATRAELEAHIEEAQRVSAQLARANADLVKAKESAETANRAKSDFLAVMSHELRTPLNAIGGYVQLLELGVHGPLTAAQLEALARVSRSHQRLLSLINDVLNFAKLDAGQVRYDLRTVPVDEALDALEPLVAPQVRARNLQYLHAPSPVPLAVHADNDRLQQIVLNLLSNAIKFTRDGGTIAVDCEAAGDMVRIHVRDSGVGIAPDRARAIFEPFVQIDQSPKRPHEGVGLGLSISRDLARGMGGDLTVTSEPGRGSVFTVVLPRANPDRHELEATAPVHRAADGLPTSGASGSSSRSPDGTAARAT
jgi:signal transduction histidine kinase